MTHKSIPLSDVRIGMYLHAVNGGWLSSPFWRRRFLIESADTLDALHDSRIATVTIDLAKGVDVAPPAIDSVDPVVEPGAPDMVSPVERRATPRLEPKVGIDPALADFGASLPMPALHPGYAPPAPTTSIQEELGAASHIIAGARNQVESLLEDARLGNALNIEATLPLIEQISDSVMRNASALISIARLKSADDYTYMHSVAVCALMVNFGRQLGFDQAMTRDIGVAGLLHDIGKMTVPGRILRKPDALTDKEVLQIQMHPESGFAILRKSGNVPDIAMDVCLHHHEKMDGTGYPHRLTGDRISLFARMGAICDVYDAVTSNRAYKVAWRASDAVQAMASWDGHFDRSLLDTFISSIGIYPVGTLVRLRSERLALVTCANHDDMTRPVVRSFYSTTRRARTPIHDIDMARQGEDDILSCEDPCAWGFANWDAQWPKLLAG